MDMKTSGDGKYPYPQRRRKPSFSSSLLDSIYRSIDESNGREEEEFVAGTRMKRDEEYEQEIPSLRRAIMIEKWREDRGNGKSSSSSTTAAATSTRVVTSRNSNGHNGHSSSSDSSCCGTTVFSSSSDADSASRSSSRFTMQTPKRQGKFLKATKSRALQIYSDLKKVKQPISPGGRIASLLNSIFNSKNLKKPKFNEAVEDLSSIGKSRSLKESTTNCSSASSFSGTCLSNSRCKLNGSNGMKRSVRFCPVSVIVDEDCRPCGEKITYEDGSRILSFPVGQNHLEKKFTAGFREYGSKTFREICKDDNEDEDLESCSSSDLFELENIDSVGINIGVYAEELPVYGTTNLRTNQAIANGFLL